MTAAAVKKVRAAVFGTAEDFTVRFLAQCHDVLDIVYNPEKGSVLVGSGTELYTHKPAEGRWGGTPGVESIPAYP